MIRSQHNCLTPSVPRHQRERSAYPKQRHHKQNTTSRKPKGQFPSTPHPPTPHPLPLSKKKVQNKKTHQDAHDRNSKPQQKHRIGTVSKTSLGAGGSGRLKSILRGHNLRPQFYLVYTRHLFSPREGFYTNQCNISKNIKSKRIQR